MRVLVVEDEKRLASALAHILNEQKYMVDIANNGNDGYYMASNESYDIIVLDVMLPGKDGFEILRALRKNKNNTPVLMLTARSDTLDKITGLDSGADDYMTKPFETDELLARIRALTRRKGEIILDEMEFGDLIFNISSLILKCKTTEKTVRLSYKEAELLKLLISNNKISISKEDLIIKVWGYDSDASDNNVEAYISFLRRKFNYIESKCEISSIKKIGYRIEYKDA